MRGTTIQFVLKKKLLACLTTTSKRELVSMELKGSTSFSEKFHLHSRNMHRGRPVADSHNPSNSQRIWCFVLGMLSYPAISMEALLHGWQARNTMLNLGICSNTHSRSNAFLLQSNCATAEKTEELSMVFFSSATHSYFGYQRT
ncbi:hypothetical protein ANCCAN_06679 [Ancylostoma caninum]|uniref:Uncharacterized protein n=1 Tax=Ancylostoma caninum TaxID=29170 RepID=A0A368GW84_ANCCA|nr:hypothetical protein ANCCAN_06679 [Ancylostoma caninum]